MKNKEIEVIEKYLNGLISYPFQYKDKEYILSYIEQLEECYCNRTDCIGRIKDSKKYDSLLQKYKQLENNRDKAIEYCNNNIEFTPRLIDVIDILKGDSDE